MYSYKELIEKVRQYFSDEHFTGTPAELYKPIEYTLTDGGKRIRPVLMLAATQMFDGDIDDARYAAIGIETFHNFTLLHDDLMDKSPLRRGKPTVYKKWDENTAILSGDAMNTLAWHYFLKNNNRKLPEILKTFEKTSMEICEGQQYDMNFENRTDVTIAEYMEMIRLKTAVLLGCALKIGALYGNATEEEVDNIYSFGINIGLAFQLRDDLLDAYGDVATFGKQTGTDIKDNKKTYLFLLAIQKADDSTRQRLLELFNTTPIDPSAKIQEVLDIYARLDIKKDVEDAIADLHHKAKENLDNIKRPEANKQALVEIAQQLLNRKL